MRSSYWLNLTTPRERGHRVRRAARPVRAAYPPARPAGGGRPRRAVLPPHQAQPVWGLPRVLGGERGAGPVRLPADRGVRRAPGGRPGLPHAVFRAHASSCTLAMLHPTTCCSASLGGASSPKPDVNSTLARRATSGDVVQRIPKRPSVAQVHRQGGDRTAGGWRQGHQAVQPRLPAEGTAK
jgi:hypothetical protein